MRPRALIPVLAAAAVLCSAMASESVTIVADRDATLVEDPAGALANGTGPLFAGRTGQSEGSRRRAVLRFDLRNAVPPGAIVESAELNLQFLPSHNGSTVALHRLLSPWSEGSTFSGGGGGEPSRPGDVTWIHTAFPIDRWVRPGGLYVARASALSWVDRPGPATWNNDRHMAEDVRFWLHAPSRNFGWILIGDETLPRTSQRFASREDPDAALRPRLTIRYRRPPGR